MHQHQLPIGAEDVALTVAAIRGDFERLARIANAIADRQETREERLTACGSLQAAALWYAHHGLPVFPCHPGEKTPLTAHGFHEATTSIAQIRAWWSVSPYANIGLPTGDRYDVIDIDSPEGLVRFYERYVDPTEARPIRAIALTPRGRHLYYDADPKMRNRTRLLRGVDVRATGGYVIAPPSATAAGNYRWVPGKELRP